MVNFSFFLVQPFAPQQSIGDIVGPTGAPNIYRFFVAELQPQTLSTFIQNMTLADLALFFLGVLAFIFFIHQHQINLFKYKLKIKLKEKIAKVNSRKLIINKNPYP